MKIRMNSNYGVTAECKPWLAKGEVVEVDEKLAVMLLQTRRAEAVAEKSADKAEKAVAPKGETRRAAKKAAPKSK